MRHLPNQKYLPCLYRWFSLLLIFEAHFILNGSCWKTKRKPLPLHQQYFRSFLFFLWMTSYWKQWSTKFFHFFGRFIGSDFKVGSKRIGQKHPMRWNIKSISNSRLSKIDWMGTNGSECGQVGWRSGKIFFEKAQHEKLEKNQLLNWYGRYHQTPCCAAWSRFQTTWPNRLPTWFAVPRLSLHSKALGMLTWPGKTTAEKHPISRNQCFDHVYFRHRNEIGML